MPPFETYQSNAAEVPVMRKWFFRALLLSLLVHAALYFWFKATTLDRFTAATDRLVPRAFNVARLDIDPKLLEPDEPAPEPKKPATAMPNIELPSEKPSIEKMMDEVRAIPAAPEELTKPIVNEKPRVDATNLKTLTQKMQDTAAMDKELEAVRDQLIKDRPKPSQSILKLNEKATTQMVDGSSADATAMAAASGRLDGLLDPARGGLKKGDQPLTMPGGALFKFADWQLQEPAMAQLRKLGQLIKKNPRVTFVIEGYTDSFGSDATNLALSQMRADAVRVWLVENMEVDPARIEARGFGKTKFVVPPHPYDANSQASIDAEVARQQPNRRVEIVFHFPQ